MHPMMQWIVKIAVLWLEGMEVMASSVVVVVGHDIGPMLHVNGAPDSGTIVPAIE